MSKMSKKIVGITGNIASGKSSVVKYLINKGYTVIDTDKITKNIYENDIVFKKKLIDLFGIEIIANGKICKSKVAKIVFNDREALRKLNSLIHPLVREKTIEEIERNSGLLFIDVPLLFEANFDELVDKIILVIVSENKQLERLMKRNNFSKEEAIKRISSQIPQSSKIKKADYLVNNNFSIDELYLQVDKILEELER